MHAKGVIVVAGHSKWANIKHKKARADAKKGKAFSRVTKEIITAVKLGGPDPESNPRLRLALDKAKEVNLPKENIERNIKKASSADQADFEEITYELYGHGGVGIIVEVMTDNKNRSASDIRIATNKRGGSIASPGSVAYNFDKKGLVQVPKEAISEDDLFLAASDAGADDFDTDEESYIITTPPDKLYEVKGAIDALNLKSEAELTMIPKLYIECDDATQEANLALIEWLEESDDVDNVYHNMR